MASGLYNGPLGQSQVPQRTVRTPFGTVVNSGAIYNGQGQEATYSPTVGGWGVASWPSSTASGTGASGALASAQAGGAGAQGGAGTQTEAGGMYDAAIQTLLGGASSARKAAAQSQARLTNAGADLEAAREAARQIGGSAAQISGVASNLSPLAMSLNEHGDALSALARDVMGQGGALASLDPTKGGLSAEFINNYRLLSPENLVSRAASDTQSAYENVAGQQARSLSRRGVSADSGASAALRQQLNQALATALSSAKTNAYLQGINGQRDALVDMATTANAFNQAGASIQKQASDTLAQAADVWTAQSGMYGQAAGLFNSQSGAFANIGGMEVSLGELDMKNDAAVRDAINDVAAAQQALAQYYSGREATESETVSYGSRTKRTDRKI